MTTGWRYRVASVLGTVALTAFAIAVVNDPAVQHTFAEVPYFGRPAPAVLSNGDLLLAISTAVVVVLASMWQLFKPRPRRILDTILETQRRVILAMVGIAALGYFNYSYRLPRPTVMLATLVLFVTLPLYMVAIRRRPQTTNRALLVGDDPEAMRAILAATGEKVLGFVAPPSIERSELGPGEDGDAHGPGPQFDRLGGLSRIEEVILDNDIDTVLLAFDSADRAEFFGTLATCHAHGIDAKIHREHGDHVLVAPSPAGELVDIELEPWDAQDRVVKRLFDVGFAGLALFVLSPLVLLIAVAIKLDDGGPVLFGQERTAEFGDTFTVYKFRTMKPGEGDTIPGDETERITRLGRLLRRTHLDEIPQLWAILTGRMSVVGPRAVWTDEETHLESKTSTWRKRWFVKPGLTGLAQINGADSTVPAAKLRYDLEYIRRQSFWLDLKIVLRQLWQVAGDFLSYRSRGAEDQPPDDGPGANTAGDSAESPEEKERSPGSEDRAVVTDGSRERGPKAGRATAGDPAPEHHPDED